jgi:uncharacterized repeat protein (TIGR01451 family)
MFMSRSFLVKIPFALYSIRKKYGRFTGLASPVLLGTFLSVLPAIPILPATSLVNAQEIASKNINLYNRAEYSYRNPQSVLFQNMTNGVTVGNVPRLNDPRGQILGCGGQLLPDYTGFRVGLYEPDPADTTGTELGQLVSLTTTEVPDVPNNGVPQGISPNTVNVNPYPLTNSGQGFYSFLLDRSRGQLMVGSTYILVVDPPANNPIYTQRRVKIQVEAITLVGTREQVSYRATSLDGMPISQDGATTVDQQATLVQDADNTALELLAFQFSNAMCPVSQVQITKSGDRASAAVGDIVIYRLNIHNRSDGPLNTLIVNDTLPLGFRFLDNSVRAELSNQVLTPTWTQNGRALSFRFTNQLLQGETMTLVYAAQLTPDAIRGDGKNLAAVDAHRIDNALEVKDGPAIYRVRVTPGLVSDCGTILGRVFVDKNFDGEQQSGEPGIPNAALFMDDGNRITTDKDGLFSLKCVLPGYRNGTLDLTTLPGYTIAPNQRFIERNSPGRLVHLSPGGMVRMNFGVTPTFQEQVKP